MRRHVQEDLLGDHEDQSLDQSDDVGGASPVVERRQLAETPAFAHVVEADLASGERIDDDPGASLHDDEDVPPLVVAVDDLLLGREAAPPAIFYDTVPFLRRERKESRKRAQLTYT